MISPAAESDRRTFTFFVWRAYPGVLPPANFIRSQFRLGRDLNRNKLHNRRTVFTFSGRPPGQFRVVILRQKKKN
jgi:hypothetical protein